MNFSTKLISAAVLMASSSMALAIETASTDIEINVTKSEYVILTGTALLKPIVDLIDTDVNDAVVSLGTLGAETNVAGSCSVTFGSANGNKLLLDGTTNTYLHGTDTYSVQHTNDYTNCSTSVAADLSLDFPAIPTGVVLAGTYSDTLTITVTTQ